MKMQTLFPWLTRAFAIVGIMSIIFLIVTYILRVVPSATTTSYYAPNSLYEVRSDMESAGKGGGGFVQELLTDEAIAAETDQKVIKTGSLSLTVDDAVESARSIDSLATTKTGYVQTSSVTEQEDGTHAGYVVIRVPANEFASIMDELKKIAVVVDSETVSSDDVTEEYIDVAARLKNAKAQEERYVKILDSAKTVEEILQIEQALGNIRGYIESLTGQIQYLDSQTDFSTITISLSEEPAIKIGGKTFRPLTIVKQATQAVVGIAQWIVGAIIWIVIVGVGIGAPIALIGWCGRKIYRRIRK